MVKKSEVHRQAEMHFDFSDAFDQAERATKIACVEVTEKVDLSTVIHSGSLVLDLHVLGGGYQAGRIYDIQGKESGGKTTLGKMALAQAILSIPNAVKGIYCDAEGTLDKTWFKNILEMYGITLPLKKIFGKRNKNGEWVHKPIIRLVKPIDGDSYLILLTKYLNNLPDKVYHDDKWFYRWIPVEAKVAKKTGGMKEADIRALLKHLGVGPDSKMLKATGSFMVPVPNNYGGPEGIVLTDSVIALVPRQTVEDDSAAMSQHGRMFAKYLNNIKGLASRKGITIININQLREKPGLVWGNAEYAPGGNTLQYVGDCRLKVNPCANPSGGGHVEEDGNNVYRWTSITNTKNKLFTPYRKMKLRWWTSRDGVTGCGLDPVLDTIEYLEYTSQIEEAGRKGFYVVLQDKTKVADKLKEILFTQASFADFIMTNQLTITDDSKNGKLPKMKTVMFNLRQHCLNQIRSGLAFELYQQYEEVEEEDDSEESEE